MHYGFPANNSSIYQGWLQSFNNVIIAVKRMLTVTTEYLIWSDNVLLALCKIRAGTTHLSSSQHTTRRGQMIDTEPAGLIDLSLFATLQSQFSRIFWRSILFMTRRYLHDACWSGRFPALVTSVVAPWMDQAWPPLHPTLPWPLASAQGLQKMSASWSDRPSSKWPGGSFRHPGSPSLPSGPAEDKPTANHKSRSKINGFVPESCYYGSWS